jgi:hypothetical protein
VSRERRAIVVDYLLGQLDERTQQGVTRRLAAPSPERTYAQRLRGELKPMFGDALPELPARSAPEVPASAAAEAPARPAAEAPRRQPAAARDAPRPVRAAANGARRAEPVGVDGPSSFVAEGSGAAMAADPGDSPSAVGEHSGTRTGPEAVSHPRRIRAARRRRLSRLQAVLATLLAAAIAAVVVVLVSSSGSSPSPAKTSTAKSTGVRQLGRFTLTAPTKTSKAVGLAEVVQQGSTKGIVIAAANVPANSTNPRNAYALWLYNSPTDLKLVGWVQSAVPKTGRLTTEGVLPTDAAKYHYLLLSLESKASPKTPTTIVLGGKISGV